MRGYRISDLDYPLPPGRIAQSPCPERDAARLLHALPDGSITDCHVGDLPDLLKPGDLCVANETRVRAARLRGVRPGGAPAEVLVLEPVDAHTYVCLVRPARHLPPGTSIDMGGGVVARVGAAVPGHPGARSVTLEYPQDADAEAAIARVGTVPLPPYLHEGLVDPERYQTVISRGVPPASAAAPTAGLHLTMPLIDTLERRGIALARIRLDVGLGTFAPVRAEDPEDHVMHAERYELPLSTAEAVADCRARKGRVVAIGTTTLRVLETRATDGGLVTPGSGTTRLYLRPGGPLPRVADGLLTNFHQPRSSLLLLVAAFAGVQVLRQSYEHALTAGYRFLSFGDCMLCWRARS